LTDVKTPAPRRAELLFQLGEILIKKKENTPPT
jgi:hypothetical protein